MPISILSAEKLNKHGSQESLKVQKYRFGAVLRPFKSE
jgi:hypothetical protein